MTQGKEDRSLGERLGEAIVTAGHVPPSVIETVEKFVLDSFGVMLVARSAPGLEAMAAAMRKLDPGAGPAREFVTGRRVSAPTAALLNGALAHALEFDDTEDVARIHAYCVVLPAALAMAEAAAAEGAGVSGARFLEAVALGVEVFSRLAHACPDLLAAGWHPTTGPGNIAAAATGAVILRLDARATTNAMGIAYAQLCGNNQSIADNALSKRMGPGFAARNGVTAAWMAHAGLSGPHRFLEGTAGLFAQHAGLSARPEAVLDHWGKIWRVQELSMKPYPSCRCTHGLIRLGLDLHTEGLRPEDIQRGELMLGKVNWGIVNAPFAPDRATDPVVHAQFSARYTFARALLDGEVGLPAFRSDRILDPSAVALAQKFDCRIADDIPESALAGARVRLTFADGRKREMRSDVLPGSPVAPLSDVEIKAKFASNLAHGRGATAKTADALAETILSLRHRNDISAVVQALAGPGRKEAAPEHALAQ